MNTLKHFVTNTLRSAKTAAFAICLLSTGATGSIFVQQGPSDFIRQYGITFPIAQLGNCVNYSECRTFCEDPINERACATYARTKGFYKTSALDTQTTAITQAAKNELGCDSYESCQNFCEKKENFEVCSSFAQKYRLRGGHGTDPKDIQILKKAKTVLGCSSYETCKAYCEQEVNVDKCTQFARQTGIRGGEEFRGPGGCTSRATCEAYCSNPSNFGQCQSFAAANLGEFKGPGGCSSFELCKAYCDTNPQYCYGHSLLPYMPADPATSCTKLAGCSWINNICQCVGGVQNPESACRQTPGCSWTGSTCQCASPSPGTGQYYQDPQQACNSFPGCSWTGSTCECPSYTPYPTHTNYTPTPTLSSTTSTSEPTPTSGSSTGSSTSEPTPTPTPTQSSTMSLSEQETLCRQTSGCTWTGTTCECVHAVTIQSLTFPIAELGNCTDCESCTSYCANPANQNACTAFSKAKGLFEEEVKTKQDIFESAKQELGCDSESSCKAFCQREENYALCATFAAKNDIIDAPVILTPASGAAVQGTQAIEVKAKPGSTIDIMLQPLSAITDALYIGRFRLAEATTGVFTWDATNSPNGEYNLIAQVSIDGVTKTVGPIRVTVANSSVAEAPVVTVEDIILPSRFEPEKVPVDAATTVAATFVTEKTAGIMLSGTAIPNSIVTIIIYSNPTVVTVKTDANGRWTYTLEKPLDGGEHTVYVVATKPDGSQIRSESTSFIVPPAFAAENEPLTQVSADEAGPLKTFAYITLLIIAIAIFALLALYRLKNRPPLGTQ